MIKVIAATSLNGVIGSVENKLPWGSSYPEDLTYFKKQTINHPIIMGRKTWDSIGHPLPKRLNIVVSKQFAEISHDENVIQFRSYEEAFEFIKHRHENAWVIGGSSAYQAALAVAEELHITTIPETIYGSSLMYFPYVNPQLFKMAETNIIGNKLVCSVYRRV